MSMTDQFVSARQKTLARNSQDRPHQVGEVKIAEGQYLSFRIQNRSAARTNNHRGRGDADAPLQHEFPCRIELSEICDDANIGTSLLSTLAGEEQHILTEFRSLRRNDFQ